MTWYDAWYGFTTFCAFAGLGLGLCTFWLNWRTRRKQRADDRLRETIRRGDIERMTKDLPK